MNTTPTTFQDWIENGAVEFKCRIDSGEKGNPNNPMMAAHLAFDAGIQAGLALATRRLGEIVWDRKAEFIQ